MDFNNIEQFLIDGGKAEDIAKAFTAKLNEAINNTKYVKAITQTYDKIAETWNYLMNLYEQAGKLPDDYKVEEFLVNPETVEEFADTIVKLVPFIVNYAPILSNLAEGNEDSKNKIEEEIGKKLNNSDFKTTIEKFFDKMNI